jgi:DNA polymerase-1
VLIEELAQYEPTLKKRVTFKANQKVLSTYLLPMRSGVNRAMNSRPNVLVSSGRTSWGGAKIDDHTEGTNLQNFPTKGKVRDCFEPRPGHLWLGVDFSSLELRTLAQACLWICDKSTLGDGYRNNPDYDPHTEFGAKLARISKEEAYRLVASKDKEFKGYRQRAKAANFGYPGGLGPKKFYTTYAKQYKLDISLKECYQLKDEWMRTFPEMEGYFEWVNYLVNAGGNFRQFVSNRMRGGTGFCDGANTHFQGLAADGFKLALCAVSQACYAEPESPAFGSRIVAAIHDELDLEVPIVTAHETAMEVVRLMEREMRKVTPDIPQKAVPALSLAWLKEAEEKYVDGRLVAWP